MQVIRIITRAPKNNNGPPGHAMGVRPAVTTLCLTRLSRSAPQVESTLTATGRGRSARGSCQRTRA